MPLSTVLDTAIFDWLMILAGIAVLLIYEWRMRAVGAISPGQTAHGAHTAIRGEWVNSSMGKPEYGVMIIQTLRNSVMTSSFMATTAALALSGTLTLSGIGSTTSLVWQTDALHGAEQLLRTFKLLLLSITFFLSFLFAAMSVRFFNHTGYLMTTDFPPERLPREKALATAYLNRAGRLYSYGLRAFFACVPFLASLAHTWLILPAALLLVAVLYRFDRVPRDRDA